MCGSKARFIRTQTRCVARRRAPSQRHVRRRVSILTRHAPPQVQSLIIEMQVRGTLRKVPQPLAVRMPQARPTLKDVAGMWMKALNAKHRRRGAGQHAHLVSLLPEPAANKRRRSRPSRSPTKEPEADDWVPPAAKRARKKAAASPRNGGAAKSGARARTANGRRTAGASAKRPASRKSAARAEEVKPWVLQLGPATTEGGALQHTEDNCYVCRVTEGYADNPIVFCEGCNLAVHQVSWPVEAQARLHMRV